jgi:hypothetical protein
MELEISTSPRATWVWADNVDQAEEVRKVLTSANCAVSSATGKNSEARVLDLDIGVNALSGLETLRDYGYTFRWHPGQYVLNRASTLFGLAVAETKEAEGTADRG